MDLVLLTNAVVIPTETYKKMKGIVMFICRALSDICTAGGGGGGGGVRIVRQAEALALTLDDGAV